MIALHNSSDIYFEYWSAALKKNNLSWKVVDCMSSDIIGDLANVDILLWSWHHNDPSAQLMARALIKALELKNIKVYPDFNTCWHFDDKIAQKYLLEVIRAPLIKSDVLFSKADAMSWLDQTQLPFVFKLRNGAGSDNVRLISSKASAQKMIRRMFKGKVGYLTRLTPLNEALMRFRRTKSWRNFLRIFRGLGRSVVVHPAIRRLAPQRGYFYAQEFVPGQNCDIRVIVIGNRAFGFRRMVRPGDFRASGSGEIDYRMSKIPPAAVAKSFDISRKLSTQSLAFDFLVDGEDLSIVEISYRFNVPLYYACEGYWDDSLQWYDREVDPLGFILQDLGLNVG